MDEAEALLARWRRLREELDASGVRLLAVSKYAPDRAVASLASAGQRDFAESRPQALRDRALAFPDVEWHMIGPLQKNKAKYVARHAAMWHSVEDVDTAAAVARHVEGRVLPVLLQVNVAGAAHQHGVVPQLLPALYEAVDAMPQLSVAGLMCMAPKEGDARAYFAKLRHLRDALANGSLRPPSDWTRHEARLGLCMGMSGDYRTAVEEGATMVRLGTLLFGTSYRDGEQRSLP
ncbi:MAG TPA: YggS family pyridoxal phosphate-dependent enzyme [Mariprofundaceae bacterium]|nr:YggS family pyridoxal phosphate-dependent enzyme [Mariprofundaceae bacterium]